MTKQEFSDYLQELDFESTSSGYEKSYHEGKFKVIYKLTSQMVHEYYATHNLTTKRHNARYKNLYLRKDNSLGGLQVVKKIK